MLRRESIEQILKVLKRFQIRQRTSHSVIRAYQGAVEDVRKEYDVAYQTIGDLCRRRLGLDSINEFYNYLEKWVVGDPKPLVQLLCRHAESEGQHLVRDFFQVSCDLPPVPRSENSEDSEVFSIQVKDTQARKLKAMSMVKGISVSDWLSRCVAELIEEEYKKWLATEARQVLP
jgi:hypothetical protein